MKCLEAQEKRSHSQTLSVRQGGKTKYELPLKGRQWIYKLNILCTSPLRVKEQNVKWEQKPRDLRPCILGEVRF